MVDAWEDLEPASFNGLVFPMLSLDIDGSLRMPRRARPYRDGAKLDSTGTEPEEFKVEAIFHANVTEPGDSGPPMWPDRLNQLIAQFKLGYTGTLHLPWMRNIRCKAERWSRRANSESHRGGETLSVTFVEDNEENLEDSVEYSTVRATAQQQVLELVVDAEAIAVWDGTFEDLTQFAADLEGVLNAPGEFLEDVIHKAKRVANACRRIMAAIATKVPGRDQGEDPASARVMARLLALADAAAQAQAEAEAQLPATIEVRYQTDRDIYDIATERGQSARDLIAINSEIEDISYIPAGTPVKVFA